METRWLDFFWLVQVTQSCLTFCDPMDKKVHGILQARILDWAAFSFSRGSSQPRSPALQVDILPVESQGKPKNTGVSSLSLLQGSFQPRNRTRVSCIAGEFFTTWAIRAKWASKAWWHVFKGGRSVGYISISISMHIWNLCMI